MASTPDHPNDSTPKPPCSGTSGFRVESQSRREFELEFMAGILARHPFYTDVLRVHACNLAAIGEHGRALQLDRLQVRLLPHRPIPWYNLACGYAALGMIDAAFMALERAIDLGFNRPRLLRNDRDLDSLRDDPRFARLSRRIESITATCRFD